MNGRRGAVSPLRGRFYFGWIVVTVLALTVTVAYGVLMYAFPVVLIAMEAELGWSPQVLTGGYSLSALVGGLAAVPVGRWLDRHGPHGIMTISALGASLLVAGWARVDTPIGFYLAWIGLGFCSAGLFYEPAFTTIAQWFRTNRARALTIVTVAGGLASTIFVPLTASLVERFGWRNAVLALAGVLALTTILPHAWALRRRPALAAASRPIRRDQYGPDSGSFRGLLGVSSLRWLTLAFCLSSMTNMAFAIHLIPLLVGRGHSLAFASLALGTVGIMKLLGRLLIMAVAHRATISAATLAVFGLQALGPVMLTAFDSPAGVWACVALVGLGDGASTPARAELVAQFYGTSAYGAISGAMALFQSIARSLGPIGASLVIALAGGYTVVLLAMTAALVSAGGALRFAMKRAGRRTGSEPAPPVIGRRG